MEIRKLTGDEFFPLFNKHRVDHFKETLWFSAHQVRTAYEDERFNSLYAGFKNRWELHLALFENDKLIGWCSSFQTRPYELYMMNSVVFAEHRRKGYYTKMVQEVLKEAKAAGFQIVTSNHICTNNDVIIPKLKLNFMMTGFEVLDEFGVVVKLTHYLNEVRGKAIEFRSGQMKPDEALKTLFKI